jgi:hypothetical protein
MFIQKVLSYGNAWGDLTQKHPNELDEVSRVLEELTFEAIEALEVEPEIRLHEAPGVNLLRLTRCWDNAMRLIGWQESLSAVSYLGSRPIHLRALGYISNGVSVSLLRNRELLNRWLFTVAPIARKGGYVAIPVAVVLLSETLEALRGRRMVLGADFERTKDELAALQPLSHSTPFLILGISINQDPLEVVELEAEAGIQSRQVVVNRAIEFPPQYHQAGLGILNYFGTVLRERYPEGGAVVKIEQDGLTVRLIVESENGDRETIEKALHDYEMVVVGESPPEALFESRAKVLELRNELRIAQVRIESQRDLMEFQEQHITTLKQLFAHTLALPSGQPVSVTVNPTINVSASSYSTSPALEDISVLSEYLQELLTVSGADSSMQFMLQDLDESLNAVARRQSPDEVRGSGGMKKLRNFLDEATKTGSSANEMFKKLEDGFSLLQRAGKAYNNIAAWCGAPQVPNLLLGGN